jgi:2-methylcitrate dehydratase PrpD
MAEFAVNLKLADVPDEVVARAKALILDGFGCGLFAANVDWTDILAKVFGRLEPYGGNASIWGRGGTASPTNAALLNGTMIQGYELDDANPATMHSCAVVLPAVFAAAEYLGAEKVTGERLLTAIIAGFEIGPRVGLCVNGNRLLVKGWHTPGIFGPFPATVAAGLVIGLDSEQMYQALGIAGAQAAGLMASQFGSMVKRMLCGRASQTGVYAALLAAEGFTGIEDIFETEYGGFCTTFTQSTDQFDLAALTDGLGSRWETMRISVKRHACVGTNLGTLDAIEELMTETGITAADVEAVTVAVTQSVIAHSGWSPYVPTALTAAQMHLGFCVATMLIEGEVFVDQMVEKNIARPDLVELANRVTVVHSPEREQKGRPFARGADVEIRLRNGTTLTKTVDYFLGSFLRPMSSAQMATKYRRLAGRTLTAAKLEELEGLVRELQTVPSALSLLKVLHGKS